MPLIFIDGFDHYASADIPSKWDGGVNSAAINAGGRRGGGALLVNSVGSARKNIPSGSSFVIGFAYWCANGSTPDGSICGLDTGGLSQCRLRLTANGSITYTRSDTTVIGTSNKVLSPNRWSYIEWKAQIANSIAGNSCIVRVDGNDVINLAAGTDTQQYAGNTAEQFHLLGVASTTIYDDLYISSDTAFLGDCRIDTLFPDGDGTNLDFNCSTGNAHYALVDEATPNTTDYTYCSTVNARDSYNMADMTGNANTIYCVQVNGFALKDDANSKEIRVGVLSGANYSYGNSTPLSATLIDVLGLIETDPNTAGAWSVSAINALQAVCQVTT